ncbi:MAG: glycosyltransferase [Deltaproteobacteria bacterium]|nr:glycosyltransferase [Deltaproteobacteria bacterium]
MRISVLVPIFDRRDCGLRALESALAQDAAPGRFEVVAVIARRHQVPPQDSPRLEALLAQAHQVVWLDLDAGEIQNEIWYYQEGVRSCVGEFLFLAEGHTEILPGALRKILEYLDANPACEVLWGHRGERARTSLGRLLIRNAARHNERGRVGGFFSFGGTSVIRRDLWEGLGGIDPRYLRFNEVVLRHRILRAGKEVHRVLTTFCLHHNDISIPQLAAISSAMGRGKRAAYGDAAGREGRDIPHLRHPAYRWFMGKGAAALGAPLFWVAAYVFLFLAVCGHRLRLPFAFRTFILGLGCADLWGYCRAGR